MSERAPLHFPTSWTHFVIAVTLSPRARKNALDDASEALSALTRLTRASSGARVATERLPPALVTLPLLDLGACPRALEPLLTRALRRAASQQETFKVTPEGWSLSPEDPSSPRCLSLTVRDRALRLEALSATLAQALRARGCECAPVAFAAVPLAFISADPPDALDLTAHLPHLPPPQRTPIWVNEFVLLRRPHAYQPRVGYELASAAPLPIERVERVEEREAEQKETQKTHTTHELGAEGCLPCTAEANASKKEDEAQKSAHHRAQELLNALERRLAERSQPLPRTTPTSPTHPTSPNPTQQRPKRRRRPSRSSHTTSNGD